MVVFVKLRKLSTRLARLRSALGLLALLAAFTTPAAAEITVTGSYDPEESFWTNGGGDTRGTIGNGSLSVTNGSSLSLREFTVGPRASISSSGSFTISSGGQLTVAGRVDLGRDRNSYSTGLVTGLGTRVSIGGRRPTDRIWVGQDGLGRLTIADQAVVDVTGSALFSYGGGIVSRPANGDLILDQGTLNAHSLYLRPQNLFGQGTINATGLVRDGWDDYVIDFHTRDSNHARTMVTDNGRNVEININADGTGTTGVKNVLIRNGAKVAHREARIGYPEHPVTGSRRTPAEYIVTGTGTEWTINTGAINFGGLKIGDEVSGILRIEDGGTVNSIDAYLGLRGPSGYAYVTGPGSNWNNTNELSIGGYDSKLHISNQGKVTTDAGGVSTGDLTVAGPGSSWNSNTFRVGERGHLHVAAGGQVNVADNIFIASRDDNIGSANVYVSNDGMINAGTDGTGDFENNGTVRLFAGVGLAAGTYTPITVGADEGEFTGTGTYDAIGGVWNDAAHTFTVGSVLDGNGGIVGEDLSGQRYGFSFDGGPDSLVVSFADDAGVASFDATLLDLRLIQGERTRGIIDFTTDLADGTDVLLSYFVGDSFIEEYASFWHTEDGLTWTAFTPETWVYADGWLSFLVDEFSGYAVTVPEPTTGSLLLGVGAVWLLRRRKR